MSKFNIGKVVSMVNGQETVLFCTVKAENYNDGKEKVNEMIKAGHFSCDDLDADDDQLFDNAYSFGGMSQSVRFTELIEISESTYNEISKIL